MATAIPINPGLFNNPNTWNINAVPGVDDDVVINAAIKVTVNGDVTVKSWTQTAISNLNNSVDIIAPCTITAINGFDISVMQDGMVRILSSVPLGTDVVFVGEVRQRQQITSPNWVNFRKTSSCNVIFNGNVTCVSTSASSTFFSSTLGGNLIFNGIVNYRGNAALVSISSNQNANVYVNGIFNAQTNHIAFVLNSIDNKLYINGVFQHLVGGTVVNTGSVYILSSSIIINAQGFMMTGQARTYLPASGDVQWIMQTEVVGVDTSLYTAGLLTGYPPEAKVEDQHTYGPSGEFTGTMEPWSPAFAQALASAQRDLIQPALLAALNNP